MFIVFVLYLQTCSTSLLRTKQTSKGIKPNVTKQSKRVWSLPVPSKHKKLIGSSNIYSSPCIVPFPLLLSFGIQLASLLVVTCRLAVNHQEPYVILWFHHVSTTWQKKVSNYLMLSAHICPTICKHLKYPGERRLDEHRGLLGHTRRAHICSSLILSHPC